MNLREGQGGERITLIYIRKLYYEDGRELNYFKIVCMSEFIGGD